MHFVAGKLHKKLSKQLTQHTVLQVIAREYDSKSISRRDHRFTRSMLIGGSFHLKKLWSMKSSQRITCDGRYAFFSNYQKCIDCSSSQENPHMKFSLAARNRSEKIEDAIVLDGIPENVDLPFKGHKSCLLAVTKDNFLLRIDLESGHTLEEIKLGQPPVKFQKVNWNNMDETFVITSKQFPRQSVQFPRHNLLAQETSEVVEFIIMSCMPLEFVAKFCVSREIFGKNVVEAVVSLDILMVMYSTSHVKMFSMRALLNQYKTHQHQLYEKFQDGSTYGSKQCPLMNNLNITECPPCILEVRCRDRDVMVTMPPCHYVMWPWSQNKGYCCFSVQSEQMVTNGCLEAEDDSIEEKVSLHADDSCRIIHMKNSQLRVFKLVPQPGLESRALVEDFTIDFSTAPNTEVEDKPNVSLSGRIIKRRVLQDCQTISERTVLSMMYSDDLDMIAVLSCYGESSGGDKQLTTVGFYDNWNGKLYHQFELIDAPTEEVTERFFTFDGDTITHVFRTVQGKMECHVYKFQCLAQRQALPERCKQSKQPRRRQTANRNR